MSPEEQSLDPESNRTRTARRMPHSLSVALIVIIIILILLFWRSCSGEKTADSQSNGGTIESVEGLESSDRAISVWVRPDSTITEVLARNGLSSAAVADMGEGTYVIDIGDRDPEEVAGITHG